MPQVVPVMHVAWYRSQWRPCKAAMKQIVSQHAIRVWDGWLFTPRMRNARDVFKRGTSGSAITTSRSFDQCGYGAPFDSDTHIYIYIYIYIYILYALQARLDRVINSGAAYPALNVCNLISAWMNNVCCETWRRVSSAYIRSPCVVFLEIAVGTQQHNSFTGSWTLSVCNHYRPTCHLEFRCLIAH